MIVNGRIQPAGDVDVFRIDIPRGGATLTVRTSGALDTVGTLRSRLDELKKRGIDRLVAKETGLPVHTADDPLSAVAEGTGRVLQVPIACAVPKSRIIDVSRSTPVCVSRSQAAATRSGSRSSSMREMDARLPTSSSESVSPSRSAARAPTLPSRARWRSR